MSFVPVQDVYIDVYGDQQSWVDTGIDVLETDELQVLAVGAIAYASGNTHYAFPEGGYGTPWALGQYPEENDAGVIMGVPGGPTSLPATNVPPYCLALVIVADGTTPSAAGNSVHDALYPGRNNTFSSVTEGWSAGRVWAIFNDQTGQYDDNQGNFEVHLTKMSDPDGLPYELGAVSPIQIIPASLLAVKQAAVSPITYCWFVQPPYGPPEGYTEWDVPIACPEYVDQTGLDGNGNPLYSTTPALTYLPNRGVSITGIPAGLKLGVDAPDVTLLNFDRAKLRSGYYEDAHVEVFEVAVYGDLTQREVVFIGTLGNCDLDDIKAVVEITPYEELLNQPQGPTIEPLCPALFGQGQCQNQALMDGPSLAAHTAGATVSGVNSMMQIVLTPATVSGNAGFGETFAGSFGLLTFATGVNQGAAIEVSTFVASTGLISLRRQMPALPSIGDEVLIQAGCDKTLNGAQGCVFWSNTNNFRGFPYVPGQTAVMRQYTT